MRPVSSVFVANSCRVPGILKKDYFLIYKHTWSIVLIEIFAAFCCLLCAPIMQLHEGAVIFKFIMEQNVVFFNVAH